MQMLAHRLRVDNVKESDILFGSGLDVSSIAFTEFILELEEQVGVDIEMERLDASIQTVGQLYRALAGLMLNETEITQVVTTMTSANESTEPVFNPEDDNLLIFHFAMSLWAAQEPNGIPQDSDERRAAWIIKKDDYMPLARRALRHMRNRGMSVTLTME